MRLWAPGYPSAVAVMEAGRGTEKTRGESVYNPKHTQDLKTQGLSVNTPSLIVGAGFAGDCAPRGSNYPEFFRAASSPSCQLIIGQAGHLQFVEPPGAAGVCHGYTSTGVLLLESFAMQTEAAVKCSGVLCCMVLRCAKPFFLCLLASRRTLFVALER